MSRLRVALYWAGSCGGCDIAVLDTHEYLLEFAERIDIVFWPCVFDFKRHDLEAREDGSVDLCIFNGALVTDEHEEMAHLLRRTCRTMVASGACAVDGGIPGLVNQDGTGQALERVYKRHGPESERNVLPAIPAQRLPSVRDRVRRLADVVKVDYAIPGCPPEPARMREVLEGLVDGQTPAQVRIGCGTKSVCDECSLERKGSAVERFRRVHELVPDTERCLLEQGLLCMGPATRAGCNARCTSVGMPCRGCYGPAGEARDQGAAMAGCIGSMIDAGDAHDIQACVDGIVDPSGTFYRYSLPASVLGAVRPAAGNAKEDRTCER